mmetsp:Transcript_29279/g.45505  ORF Transcript_29279/g.45505 Transcript_29279/m.45505 type:complete len:256 (-) Transcript_29279:193-960(-)|eukprot:CAMPEP_0196803512 /NCGR_PEP_ID=MMETSP1362-20130617/2938_1 /TAXON_ID=163516 /ORGANISM="Leptocylindrus danicus, Strain CCMP1856" /LENGTH=255 /DNA_ID=CAMNT_0042175159 /DNA_START=94 /DNA_END=861 /DNA_ORIENTATION=-
MYSRIIVTAAYCLISTSSRSANAYTSPASRRCAAHVACYASPETGAGNTSPSRLWSKKASLDEDEVVEVKKEKTVADAGAEAEKSDKAGTSNKEEKKKFSKDDYAKIAADIFAGDDKRPVVLFDGVCNLCNGGVNFALDHDSVGKFRFASLQSTVGQALLVRAGKKANDISSIVLCEKEKTHFKSDAVLKIARKLDGSIPILGYAGPLVPGFLRDIVYDFVADNRYRFGEADQCRLDGDEFVGRFIPDPAFYDEN